MGFHSIGRADPGKQITNVVGGASGAGPKTEIIPSPPDNIARFIGTAAPGGGQGISDAMGSPVLINNVVSSGVSVGLFIDGPDGNFKVGEVSVGAGATEFGLASVQLPIQEGETVQAQMNTPNGEVNVFAPWLDYRKDDVLHLSRTILASGTGYQTVVPAPTPGKKNILLGQLFSPNSGRAGAEESLVNARINNNGTLIPVGGDVAPAPADTLLPLGGANIALEDGQSFEGESIEGDPILYVSFLSLPNEV